GGIASLLHLLFKVLCSHNFLLKLGTCVLMCLGRCRAGLAVCPVLLGPANGACRIAKSEEMSTGDAQRGVVGVCRGDGAQEIVGRLAERTLRARSPRERSTRSDAPTPQRRA